MNDEYLKHVNFEVTDDIKQFVHDEVFGDSEYLFTRKVDGKNLGYCSKCNHEYEVEALKHNERGICPICDGKLTVKLSRYGRKKCLNDACFYYFEKSILDTNILICKGYYVSKDYSKDYKNPKIDYSLQAVYIFGDKKATMLTQSWYSNFWETKSSVFDFNQGWLGPKMCYISPESIKRATKNNSFKYIPKELLKGYFSTIKVFAEFAKYPWLEQLYKIGFRKIVEAKIKGNNLYNCLNYRGKDLFKIIRLSKRDVKEITSTKTDITPLFLRLYQLQVRDKSSLSVNDIKDIENAYGYNYEKLKKILKHTTMRKAARYMEKQYKKYKENYYSASTVAIIWSDYLDNCIDLELDLSSEHVLFPKNIYVSHQNAMKQVKIKANKLLNGKIAKRVRGLNEKYYFEYKGLLIRAAGSTEELILEGKELNHCVATNYTKPYAKGETNILFIRKISEPDKPYFTMEVKDKRIIQTHGKSNCGPTKEVQEFVEAFKNEKLSEKKGKVKIPA